MGRPNGLKIIKKFTKKIEDMKTKTIKTPSVCLKLSMSFCAKCHGSVVKSQLLRHSHTTRHNHCHGSSPQKEKTRFAKKTMFEILVSRLLTLAVSVEKCFSCFFLDEKDSLKGITVFALRLSECLHTSRLTTNGVNTLTRVSFSARGF